jgi:phage baseplate assembly protein W
MTVYSDIDFRMLKATGNDVNVLLDEYAIKQSVKNIILTRKGELPQYPEFGSRIYDYLGEKNTIFTKLSIQNEIRIALENFEPRIRVLQVETEFENNTLTVDVTFEILTINTVTNISINIGLQ